MSCAQWLLYLVLGQRWLAASRSDCGPDSAPECGMFDGMYELIFGTGSVLAVIGLLIGLGVLMRRSGALAAGAVLHLVALCQLSFSIDAAPISDAEQTLWGWVFALSNLALAFVLFGILVTPELPEQAPRD
ncbi:hypothetical protein AB0K52_06395 [Glycomyces sp. NPDC049804]|uniref:hypothetical protein n=1 Tax=Glycomyces sp. NPDC049804 TaxID=3154363 RepID=UPI00342E084E